MTGTFSSLNTALSALRYNRVVMDVASSNIANVSTQGYTRRRVEAASVAGPSQPAMWSRYDGKGEGVTVTGLSRMTDALLDARVRTEHASQHYLDVRQTVLAQVEEGIGEPGDNGVSAALAQFRAAFHDLTNNPASAASRDQVLARAGTLVDAITTQSRNLDTAMDSQRVHVVSSVDEVNSVAASLADANKAIAAGSLNGADVSVLMDTRDQLTLRLSELTGATATIRSDGGADVTLNGVSLVSGKDASVLSVATGITPTGTADGNPLSYTLTDPSGAVTTLTPAPRGEIGALTDLIDVTLPGYRTGLDAVAKDLADSVNAVHQGGYDQDGNPGVAFFGYDPTKPSASIAVAITDGRKVAASSVAGAANNDTANADALATAGAVEGHYQQLVNGFGTAVLGAQRAATNQQALTNQFDGAREQLAGVNLDEEMVSMMSAQRAYEAASRVMTTLDSVLDTLINRTGRG